MSAPTLPHVRQALTEGNTTTGPFYNWFSRIQKALEAGTISDDEAAASIAAIATALGSPDGTVANIPPLAFLRSTTYVHAGDAIEVSGSLAGGGVDVGVADDGVTNAKLANMAASRIKARKTGSTGDPEDCTITEVLDLVAGTPTKGDLIVRDTSAMARIAASTAGHVLTSNGAGALPTYQAVVGGGGAMTLVGTATVAGSAATTLTMSGLDLGTDGCYLVLWSLKTASGAPTISLYYNADTTATNYWVQYSYNTNGATNAPARANTGVVDQIFTGATSTGEIKIRKDLDGRPRAIFAFSRDVVTTMQSIGGTHARNNTANVTSITLTASVANSLAVGSYFKVWKIN